MPRTKTVKPVDPDNPYPALLATWEKRIGLSSHGMADYFGVPYPTYRNWLAGDRFPPAPSLRLIEVMQMIELIAPDVAAHFRPTTSK